MLILIVAALIATFLAAPFAATIMVSVDKKQVNAGGAALIQSNHDKRGDTAKSDTSTSQLERHRRRCKSAWTSIAVVEEAARANDSRTERSN